MKTIVLPVPKSGSYSVEEYKDEFGIDLTKYIIFEDSEIHLSFPNNSLILLDCSRTDTGSMIPGIKLGLIPFVDSSCNAQDPGRTDAGTIIGIYNSADGTLVGLGFIVDKDADLTIENVKIINA